MREEGTFRRHQHPPLQRLCVIYCYQLHHCFQHRQRNIPCDSLCSSQVPGFEVDEDEWKSKKEKMLEQGLDLHSGGNGGVKGRKKSKKDKLREAARREAAE